MTSTTKEPDPGHGAGYRSSLVYFRGSDLLRQAIAKYDSVPFYGSYWIILSSASLLFASGTTLGTILQFRYPANNDIIVTCAILATVAMLFLCIGGAFYMESVAERKAKLIETLEAYMDAQADCAKYGNREAH